MDMILGLLLELVGQIVLEIVAEIAFGLGEMATRGRMKRVIVFAVAGAVAGTGSWLVRPRFVLPDPVTRYAAIAALALGGGLFLALFEARIRRGGPGAATGGFLSGVAFGAAYVWVRHLLLT